MQLTPEAKIASDFYFIRAIFAFVGFVSALGLREAFPKPFLSVKFSRAAIFFPRVLENSQKMC